MADTHTIAVRINTQEETVAIPAGLNPAGLRIRFAQLPTDGSAPIILTTVTVPEPIPPQLLIEVDVPDAGGNFQADYTRLNSLGQQMADPAVSNILALSGPTTVNILMPTGIHIEVANETNP